MSTKPTPDEINDAIGAQVEREMPTPANGFATEEEEDDHKAAHEKRFFELVQSYCENLNPEDSK